MRTYRSLLVAPLFAAMVAACGDATGSSRGNVSFSVSTRSSASLDVAPTPGPITITTGANTLVITKAQIVLSEIELEMGADDCASGTAGCAELYLDPVLVDLPLDGVKQLDLAAVVPPGTYRELEFHLDGVQSAEGAAASAFLAANPNFANVAVRVEGTYNGEPFTFTTSEDVGFELQFEPAVDIGGATGRALTLGVDVASWFKDTLGNVMDPRNGSLQSSIVANIKLSFKAFDDIDRDGLDDDA